MIKDVTDLELHNLSLDLLDPLYKLTSLLPTNHRRLRYQANDAAEKIAPQKGLTGYILFGRNSTE